MTSRRTRMRLIERLREQGIADPQVLETMANTPRHLFIDEALAHRAYEDTALPIGLGQTISQPYIVARMTELLLEKGTPQRVLELGTGSGYQAAVLAPLVSAVYSVERIEPLLRKAKQRFQQLKLNNIHTRMAGSVVGWPEQGPFDAIIVTAAPDRLPDELLAQLVDGGRMVVPVGGDGGQHLWVIDRQGDEYNREQVEAVRFVPLLGGVVR